MMLSPLHKLWDKGVDIAAAVIAGAITAVIVAAIGLASWRIKLWLDLRADAAKQKQQRRVKKELEGQDEREKEKARRRALNERREHFVDVAEKTIYTKTQAALWDEVLAWMKSERLTEIPANLERSFEGERESRFLRSPQLARENPSGAGKLAQAIRNIELPPTDVS